MNSENTPSDTDNSFRDQPVSTVDKKGKRKWIYALQPKGKLYKIRSYVSFIYLAVFFVLPFIKVNGNPIFLFNIPKATFILFGKVFLPQDFVILGVAMLVALLFIIVFTLVFGRVFCGWACPQTVFLEMVFRRIEYWIEGPAQKQMSADAKQWTTEMYIRKTIKHLVYFGLSFIIANTFLAYIIGIDELYKIITEPVSQHITGFIAIIGFTTTFYFVFAYLREIVCTVVCPYGRLQSVLLDKNSLVVAYDYIRGEPRGKRKKADLNAPKGDCIDCNMCVNVCPTGIDIRNGIQLECVSCTACIDACNMMMKNIGKEPNLIKISSENSIAQGVKPKFNYRAKMYTAALAVLLIVLTSLIITRSMFDATILRVPGQILQENSDGTISNLYRIKVVSKSMHTEPYALKIKHEHARIEYVGKHLDSLESGVASEETFFIKVPAGDIKKRKEKFPILIMSGDKVIQRKEAIFIGEY
jgi:cytochrome c oxidase accessory protein FixG